MRVPHATMCVVQRLFSKTQFVLNHDHNVFVISYSIHRTYQALFGPLPSALGSESRLNTPTEKGQNHEGIVEYGTLHISWTIRKQRLSRHKRHNRFSTQLKFWLIVNQEQGKTKESFRHGLKHCRQKKHGGEWSSRFLPKPHYPERARRKYFPKKATPHPLRGNHWRCSRRLSSLELKRERKLFYG